MAKQNLTPEKAAYFAGLLDGEGSIFVQIVHKKTFTLLFGLQLTLTYTQESKRKHYLLIFQKEIGKDIAFLRDRKDGQYELAIYGWKNAVWFLKQIQPYLVLKRRQAALVLQIAERSSSVKNCPIKFLESCELADKIAEINNSKSQTNTTAFVRAHFLELKLIEK